MNESKTNEPTGTAVRSSELLADDTQWQCTICGRIGTVGRCCGLETRKPLNDAAREEEQRIKSANDLAHGTAGGGNQPQTH